MYLCTEKLISDDRVWREEFIIPGTFDISAGTNTAGTLTRWYRDHLFPDALQEAEKSGINAYELMMKGVSEIQPGSNGLITLPYFAGERTPINDPLAKGAIFGLTLDHTRAHLYRSALESVGFAINQHFKIFDEHKAPIHKIMATGGGTKNSVWLQIISDITGQEIKTPLNTIGACFGDAMMAAIGIQYFKDYANLAALIKEGDSYKPNFENHEKYKTYQAFFDELYPLTKNLAHRL
jgi:xylulokinase